MGLTLGERKCLNCKKYSFSHEDFKGKELKLTDKRGDFKINLKCGNCGAEMALIIYEKIQYNSLPTYNTEATAIAYAHTENDEPCYDEECELCTGEEKGGRENGQ